MQWFWKNCISDLEKKIGRSSNGGGGGGGGGGSLLAANIS